MNKYKYSQIWFLYSEIKNNLFTFLDKSKENKILEIGCFEGLSSVFFADNFIDNQNSILTCVDPFLTIHNNDHSKFLQNNEIYYCGKKLYSIYDIYYNFTCLLKIGIFS